MRKGLFLRILISVAILAVLLYKIGFGEIVRTVSMANPVYIILAVASYIITLLIDSVNLFLLLKKNNTSIPVWRLIKYNLYAWSIGLILPGRAGDFVILPMLKKEGIEIGKGLSAIIINKFISLLLMAVVAAFGVYIFFGQRNLITFLIFVLLGIISFCLLFSEKIRSVIKKRILKSYATYFTGFSKNMNYYMKEGKSSVAVNFFLTLAKMLIGGFCPLFLFYSIGQNVNFFMIIIIFNTSALLTLIPITLSGLGVRESAGLFLFSLIGVSLDSAGVAVILSTVITYLLGALFFFLPSRKN